LQKNLFENVRSVNKPKITASLAKGYILILTANHKVAIFWSVELSAYMM